MKYYYNLLKGGTQMTYNLTLQQKERENYIGNQIKHTWYNKMYHNTPCIKQAISYML